jgi:hypothetical protein
VKGGWIWGASVRPHARTPNPRIYRGNPVEPLNENTVSEETVLERVMGFEPTEW